MVNVCGVDHPESRKSTHKSALFGVTIWESHWSHLLPLVHHAIIHLSMSSLSLCMRPMCPGVSSLFVLYMWHSRSILETQIYSCDSDKPKASKPNRTKPFHLSLCAYSSAVVEIICEWERDVREQGMLHLDHRCELLCELGLGLQSKGISWRQQCCPPQEATVHMELTISNRGKIELDERCVIMRVVLVIWSYLFAPTCSFTVSLFNYIWASSLFLNKTNIPGCKLIGCFVQVALHLRSENPNPWRWLQEDYVHNA